MRKNRKELHPSGLESSPSKICFIKSYDYEGPCHRGMGHPRIADGGDGLCVWRVAANILSK